MLVRLLRDFRGMSRGDVLDVRLLVATVWVVEGIAESAEPPAPEETPDEEGTFVQIRFLIDIHGPIGTYDAGDEIEVVEHFAEAWIEAGIAEPASVESEAPPEAEAEAKSEGGEPPAEPASQTEMMAPPRTAMLPAAKPRASRKPPAARKPTAKPAVGQATA